MASVKPSDLTLRQGKTLRYFVYRKRHGEAVVPLASAIVQVAWSDLPKTERQALNTLSALSKLGLVERRKNGFEATVAGDKLVTIADKEGLWNAPPSPKKTNPTPRR